LLVFFTGTKAKSTDLALGCIRTFYALSASNKTSLLANIGHCVLGFRLNPVNANP
jgi:hypothetical protein